MSESPTYECREFPNSVLMSVEEAAISLRIGRTRAFELVMRGELQSVKIGHRRLVVREGLRDFVNGLLAAQGSDSE